MIFLRLDCRVTELMWFSILYRNIVKAGFWLSLIQHISLVEPVIARSQS